MMRLIIHSFTKHALILLRTTTSLRMRMKLNLHPMMANSVSHQSFSNFDSDNDAHSGLDLRSDAMTNSSSSGDESDNDDMVDFTRQLSSSFDLEHQFSDD